LQIVIVPETIVIVSFFVGCILFTLYLILKTCSSGDLVRTERQGGTPRIDDSTMTQAAYGQDVSYSPGERASSAGPFPVGGRVERFPTKSFRDYTNPRGKSKENQSDN
jgi:hypothetical protein